MSTGRSAGLEGDASADGLGSLGAATGRWLTRGMLEAYACLGAALAEEQAAAERAAAHEQLAGGRARSLSLGRDRAGASYWAIGPRAPLSVWVEPSPRGGQRGGGAAAWRRCVGLAAVEALAASLDARGAAERALQKSLWRLCDDSLRAEHDAAAAPSRAPRSSRRREPSLSLLGASL